MQPGDLANPMQAANDFAKRRADKGTGLERVVAVLEQGQRNLELENKNLKGSLERAVKATAKVNGTLGALTKKVNALEDKISYFEAETAPEQKDD
jgi:hypothetical protein